jgi:hypothetical protein
VRLCERSVSVWAVEDDAPAGEVGDWGWGRLPKRDDVVVAVSVDCDAVLGLRERSCDVSSVSMLEEALAAGA